MFLWARRPCVAHFVVCLLLVLSNFTIAQSSCSSQFLAHECPTATRFCSSVLSEHPYTLTLEVNEIIPTIKATATLRDHTEVVIPTTTSSVTQTVHLTHGRTSITSDRCVLTTTCGGATYVNTFRAKTNLFSECACLIGRTSRVTSTITVNEITTIYKTNSTITRTFDIGAFTNFLFYTTTTTTVPTITVDSCILATPARNSCGNKGYDFAAYNVSDPSVFSVSDYKGQTPDYNSTGLELGGFGEAVGYYGDILTGYLYGPTHNRHVSEQVYPNNTYLNMRLYIYALETGAYNFSIQTAATLGFIWVGDKAYSGYNESNADLVADNYSNDYYSDQPFPTFTKTLQRGKFYPIRVGYFCSGLDDYAESDGCSFWVNVVRPDGHVEEGSAGYDSRGYTYSNLHSPDVDIYGPPINFSPNAVRFGCGTQKRVAPPFLDWNKET